jgi:predicted SAM-dependent methyltransferase
MKAFVTGLSAELSAARNLPESETPVSGISESAGDTNLSGGDAKGLIIPPLKLKRGVRLNLGSGQRPFKGWINVDSQEKWMPDIVADIRSMPMFADNSAEIIVLWHVIEHFGCGEADPIIKECYRILQAGGRLIVATPDLGKLARAFTRKWSEYPLISEQIYVTNLYGAYMGDEADRHKWGWSQRGLLEYIANFGPWSRMDVFDGCSPEGSDISTDWWMATCEAIK